MSEYLDSTLVYWGWRTPPSEPEPEPDPTQLMIAISVVVATFCVLMAIRQMRLRSVEPPPMELVGVVSGIFVYPLKSARGVAVPEATVTPRGLTNDRLWMAVDANGDLAPHFSSPMFPTSPDADFPASPTPYSPHTCHPHTGAFLSQRRAPRLALIEANLPGAAGAALVLHMPGMAALTVHPVDSHAAKRRVRVWDDQFLAIDQGNVPAAWLASALEIEGKSRESHTCPFLYPYATPRPFVDCHPSPDVFWSRMRQAGVRLVRMADDERRECDRKYAPRDQHVAFSDGFPLLLTSEPSLGELNARVAARGKPVVPMDRFRPNLVIRSCDGVERLNPFAEDRWEAISLGDADGASFGVVKPCTRCKIPTIDQASATQVLALATFRLICHTPCFPLSTRHAFAPRFCATLLRHAFAPRFCATLLRHAFAPRFCPPLADERPS